MNLPDPKWLDIIKASGWQNFALSIASLVILAFLRNGMIPTDGSPLWIAIPLITAIVFGCLGIASAACAFLKATQPLAYFSRWLSLRSEQRAVRDYIPHLTKVEQDIIAYLLYHDQKMFQADRDGGYAAPLISKGIIRITAQPGQVLDLTRVPFAIPNHIWTVLLEQRSHFPHKPEYEDRSQPHPRVIPWMAK